ncbi:testis-expressed basic protein 1 [Eptesicus fuscus]|uniref:testis-expressed basic protein 1 n=1 Tax=Eptesicus fuscus TaxID=29078 RepID=UPI0024047D86|nr:testis-expressed basic protein 1 [Eptesicus fuscus]
MAVWEITLAVILTLLGLAILAILLTRWTRLKQNEMDASRYNSEQSASLLDYEDGRDFSSQRSEGGRAGATPHKTHEPAPHATGLPPAPITISQRTSTRPGIYKEKQEQPPHVAVPIITTIPIALAPVAAVDDSGKITLSPVVIFPGYMEGELAKKSDPRASILKSGGTAKSKSSEEENKEALKKEISFPDSNESLVHETESERKAKDTDLDTGKIDMEAKVKESDMGMPKREEAQEKEREAGIPQGQASQVKESEVETPQGQASQEKESEAKTPKGPKSKVKKIKAKTPQGPESQVKASEAETPQGPESQVKESEAKTPKGPKSKVKKSEAKTPKGPKSKVKKSEAKTPQGPESQVKASEAKTPKGPKGKVKSEGGTPQGQKAQEKTESSEAKENQVKEKEDAGKTKDTKETDAQNKKSGEGKDQVKGKKEPQVKRKKAEAKKDTGN